VEVGRDLVLAVVGHRIADVRSDGAWSTSP
jgi:hypothetical protein